MVPFDLFIYCRPPLRTAGYRRGYGSIYQAATVKVTDIQLPFNKMWLDCGPLTPDGLLGMPDARSETQQLPLNN